MCEQVPFFTLADPQLCETPRREQNRDFLERLRADVDPGTKVLLPEVLSFIAFLSAQNIPRPPPPPPPMENFTMENSGLFFYNSDAYRKALNLANVDERKYTTPQDVLHQLQQQHQQQQQQQQLPRDVLQQQQPARDILQPPHDTCSNVHPRKKRCCEPDDDEQQQNYTWKKVGDL
jgi:hypothetical protein